MSSLRNSDVSGWWRISLIYDPSILRTPSPFHILRHVGSEWQLVCSWSFIAKYEAKNNLVMVYSFCEIHLGRWQQVYLIVWSKAENNSCKTPCLHHGFLNALKRKIQSTRKPKGRTIPIIVLLGIHQGNILFCDFLTIFCVFWENVTKQLLILYMTVNLQPRTILNVI